MVNTPPPPNPAPGPDQTEDGTSAAVGHGGLDRDVNSILANLNQEQLASIVAAARASESGGGESEAASILASLPPGIEAASALTSFASSFKQRDADAAGREGDAGRMTDGVVAEEGAVAADADTEGGEAGEYKAHAEHDNADGQHPDNKKVDDEGQEYTHVDEGDQSTQLGDQSAMSDDYRNENATQAAIAAMESLAQQHIDIHGRSSSRGKRDTGPEAERMRKDQHKEVERKRREQISNGIVELAAIVPGCDAKGINKTAIINAAVRYIVELKNNEASNIEKWTLEKLLMDQAMGDLNSQLEVTRKEVSRLRAQLGLPDEPLEVEQAHEHDAQVYAEETGDEGQVEEQHSIAEDAGGETGVVAATEESAALDSVVDKDGAAAAANALEQVAEAAVVAAAEADQDHGEGAEDQDTALSDDAKLARGGRRRGASEVEAVKEDASNRAKRSRNA